MSNYNTSYGYKKISDILSLDSPHIHFSGGGGVGMYSLVCLSLKLGYFVSVTDRQRSEYTDRLSSAGVRVSFGKDFGAVCASTLVVYSLAVDMLDEELIYAASLGIPRVSRADYLSFLMESYATKIAISGTHGKSTVTAMTSSIFSRAGIMPTTVSGAMLSTAEPYILGEKRAFIYEACEYRDSFLCMKPDITAVTNIEYDHPDYFKDEAAVRSSFLSAVNNSRELAVLPFDDRNTERILKSVKVPYVTYGTGGGDYEYSITAIRDYGCEFSVRKEGAEENFYLSAIGAYNVANVACAATVAFEYGISKAFIKEAFADFTSPKRRLEYIGNYKDRSVLYDYAHHPTEIAAAIGAVKSWYGGRVSVVFKPHTYTRTKALWGDFARALSLADYVILTDIFPAREEPIFDISSQRLAGDIGSSAAFVADDEVLAALSDTEGAIVIMGAGNLDFVIKSMGLKKN